MRNHQQKNGLENKAISALSSNQPQDEIISLFEAFKDANDRRLNEMEKRMSADIITIEQVDKINRALDDQKDKLDRLYLKGNRPSLEVGDVSTFAKSEINQAFEAYIRKGLEQPVREFEGKALAVNVPGDGGGYLVPDHTETEIGRLLATVSPIRAISSVRQVSTNIYRKPFVANGATVGWVGEQDGRVQTEPPKLEELQFPTMELYTMPAATQTLLDDSAVNIDQWLAEEVQTAFAEQEGEAFVSGDGVNKPSGFLHAPQVDNANWVWGKLGTIKTGDKAKLPATNPSDPLFNLVYSLPGGYRQNACWVMNRQTQSEIRKIKDASGNYIWQPLAGEQSGASLMGLPVVEAEAMPTMGSNQTPIAFGDFKRGYLIVDRIGVRILRDPYSAKPYVLFYTTKRVGGGIQDYKAIKLLKCAS